MGGGEEAWGEDWRLDCLRKLEQEAGSRKPENEPAEKVEHCPCGTGCPECYGKLNCGCPDCYVQELKRGKKKKVSLELAEPGLFPSLAELHRVCTVSRVPDTFLPGVTVTKPAVRTGEEVTAAFLLTSAQLVRVRRLHGDPARGRNRWSQPAGPVKEKEAPAPSRRAREPLEARQVGPPKQVKYFCKKCGLDVCNACFSTVCSSHAVQWIGSCFFHCASPHHKIVHDLGQ